MGLTTMGVVERANFSASFGATATPIERSWAKLVFCCQILSVRISAPVKATGFILEVETDRGVVVHSHKWEWRGIWISLTACSSA